MIRRFVPTLLLCLATTSFAQPAPSYLGSFGNVEGYQYRMQSPLGMCCDAAGNVWVADVSLSSLRLFSAEGVFLTSPTLYVSFSYSGVALLTSGELAVVASSIHLNHLVIAPDLASYTSFQETVAPFDVVANPAGGYWISQPGLNRIVAMPSRATFPVAGQPNGFGFCPDGSLYVALTDRNLVQVVGGPRGGLVFGSSGTGPGQFNRPGDVAIADGLVYVTDSFNGRVEVFSLDGTYRFQFGSPAPGPAQMRRPGGIAISPNGDIFVSDLDLHHVTRWGYAPTATSQASWGRIKTLFR